MLDSLNTYIFFLTKFKNYLFIACFLNIRWILFKPKIEIINLQFCLLPCKCYISFSLTHFWKAGSVNRGKEHLPIESNIGKSLVWIIVLILAALIYNFVWKKKKL